MYSVCKIIVKGWAMRLAVIYTLGKSRVYPYVWNTTSCCLHRHRPWAFLPEGICIWCDFYLKCSSPHIWMAHSFTFFSPLFKYHLLNEPFQSTCLEVTVLVFPALLHHSTYYHLAFYIFYLFICLLMTSSN